MTPGSPKPQKPILAYRIRDALYLNVTNACTARCIFCPRIEDPTVKGFCLKLEKDPLPDELIAAIGDPSPYGEVVFCGFGEPTLKLDTILEVGAWLKARKAVTRLDTNGHGNLIHKRPIAGDLARVVDRAHVSLNATNAREYLAVVRPSWGIITFDKVLEFLRDCREVIPEVVVTAVNYPGFDEAGFKKYAQEVLGLPFRIRPYNKLGDR